MVDLHLGHNNYLGNNKILDGTEARHLESLSLDADIDQGMMKDTQSCQSLDTVLKNCEGKTPVPRISPGAENPVEDHKAMN